MVQLIQCVPNFSEGRNPEKVHAIVESASNARVVDYSFDPDHNRMVLTLLDTPENIQLAILSAAAQAVELIDMRVHQGEHPRIGAIDVIPFVPISGVMMKDCVRLSHEIGKCIADDLEIPVFFYEESAKCSHRKNLADVRRGGYERLCSCALDGERAPDVGPHKLHPTAGAVVVGARGPLVAYNVNLQTSDMCVARAIARDIRGATGGLEGVKAIAVWLASKSLAQVSMNITEPDRVSIPTVFEFVEHEANKYGVEVAESEIIGISSKRFLDGASPKDLKITHFKESQILENWL